MDTYAMYNYFTELFAPVCHWYYYSDIVRSNSDVLIVVGVERQCKDT